MEELSRELIPPLSQQAVRLYSTNLDVDRFNHAKVAALPGQARQFVSEDKGEKMHLGRIIAPHVLSLKVINYTMINHVLILMKCIFFYNPGKHKGHDFAKYFANGSERE